MIMDDYGQVPEQGVIQFERLLPGPIDLVWTFLTGSKERGTWLAEGELELREGAPLTLYFLHAGLSPVKETIPEKYRKQSEDGCTLDCRGTHDDAPNKQSDHWGGDSEVTSELTRQSEQVL